MANIGAVKIIIGADGAQAVQATAEISAAFKTLGSTSIAEINKSRADIEAAYQTIKNSGVASAQEIKQAEAAKFKAIDDLNKQNLTSNQSMLQSIKSHWMQITAAIAAAGVVINFLKESMQQAYEAEIAFNKLKMQVNNLGVSYDSLSPRIEEAIKHTADYAMVQDEDVAKSMQQLIFLSGDLEGSMKNLNLVYDLAYMKGISQEEAAALIGKAMTGNVEMLGRYIPELKNLNDKLGENATETDKAAYALAVLQDKSKGAMENMTEHEKIVKSSTKAWEDFKEKIGGLLLNQLDRVKNSLMGLDKMMENEGRLSGLWKWATTGADGMKKYLAESYKVQDAQAKAAKAAEGEAAAHAKNAAQIAAESKAKSDAIEKTQQQIESLKKLADVMKDLSSASLKNAGETFAESLKKVSENIGRLNTEAAEYQKLTAGMAANALQMGSKAVIDALRAQGSELDKMRISVAEYSAVIDKTYALRLAGEKNVLEAYKKAAALQEQQQLTIEKDAAKRDKLSKDNAAEIARQSAQILQTELAGTQDRLGLWTQYYGTLKALHTQALSQMAQKTKELFDLEASRIAQANGYADLQNSLRQKLMTDEQKYYDQLEILRMKYDAAMQLSGEAKIKALTDWQSARAAMANEIKSGDAIIISQETAVKDAMQAIANAQNDIETEYAQTKAARESELAQLARYTQELETSMSKAAEMVDHYKQAVMDLDAELAQQRILSIDASQATAAIGAVQAALDAIPPVTYKDVIVRYFTEASPVRPFTEGMRYIMGLMDSLPTESRHTVRFGDMSKQIQGVSAATKDAEAADAAITYEKSSGISDGVAKALEELYIRLAAAEGRVAQAEAGKRVVGTPYGYVYAQQIAENEAIIRTLKNAIEKLLSRSESETLNREIKTAKGKTTTADNEATDSKTPASAASAGAINPLSFALQPGSIVIQGANKTTPEMADELWNELIKKATRFQLTPLPKSFVERSIA